MNQCIENSEAIFLYGIVIILCLGLIKAEIEKARLAKKVNGHQTNSIRLRKKLEELEGKE